MSENEEALRILLKRIPGEYIRRVLIKDIPEFYEALRDHICMNGEVLPHLLFFGDIVPYLKTLLEEIDKIPKNKVILINLVRVIESLLETKDYYMENLIYVSFLESLDMEEQYYRDLKKFFGPEVLKAAEEVETYMLNQQ